MTPVQNLRNPMRAASALLLLVAAGCDPAPGAPTEPTPAPTPEPTPGEVLDDAGTVELRRLNRVELDQTFEHTLGSDLRPGLTWPADGAAEGFDTLASALTTSPLHAELFELAAHQFAATWPLPDLADCGDPATCAASLGPLAEAAWRRPVTDPELQGLVDLVVAAEPEHGLEDALRAGAAATLLSPRFLFRVELDAAPDDPTPHRLDPFELATRLSYFLWSGPPDGPLLAAAADGSLGEDAVLREHADRMLSDPRAQALVDGFGGQWMPLRLLENAFPFSDVFPSWTPELRAPLRAELRRQIEAALLTDRSMLSLVDYDATALDAALAAHYGLDWDAGVPVDGEPDLRTFSLEAVGRRGVITNGAWLTALAQPASVSPAARGVWILNQLLCEPPEPPPPEAENFQPLFAGDTDLTEREQLEEHRSNPDCRSCHESIDPLGFALQGFDGAGAARETDGVGHPFDTSGQLGGTGEAFEGPLDLATLLARDARVPPCIVQHAFTYAVGRAPGPWDLPHLEAIEDEFVGSDHRFSALVAALVTSPTFRIRRAPEVPE